MPKCAGHCLVDFNQNNRDRTIASAYSLRPKPGAPVSTPLIWAEIADLDDPCELNFPPDYPKMPGEPPRLQPSKKVAEHWDDAGNRVAE